MPLLVTIWPFADTQLMDQCIGVDVIEAVTGRDFRRFMLEDGGEVRVFSVEVDQVRAKMPLLQHVAGREPDSRSMAQPVPPRSRCG